MLTFLFWNLKKQRLTIRSVKLPGVMPLLLVAAHLPSRRHWSAESISAACNILAGDIRQSETDAGHCNTLLVGDLNLNPFDAGLVTANGLHAVMTPEVAQRGGRVVNRRSYPFFYDVEPLWRPFPQSTWYVLLRCQ